MTTRYWSATAKTLSPYVPGEQIKGRKIIKLNTNENPFPPSPKVKQALIDEIGACGHSLRLYPDYAAQALKNELAQYHGVKPEQIFVGNGSDEVLAHIFQGLLKQRHPILFPDITYSFYSVYCGLFGIEYEKVQLTEDFSLRVDDYFHPQRQPNGGIVIANPNAPTGKSVPAKELARLARLNMQSVLVVDEAYVDYGGETVIPYIDQQENLLVVRTFSKSRALAGLRIGYALGSVSLIQALERMKDSFNSYPVDCLAQAAALASIKDNVYFEQQRVAVIENRERLRGQLEALDFYVLPSDSNFLFVKSAQVSAQTLLERLRDRHILVRYFKAPRIDNFLRISIGAQEECDELVKAFKEILSLESTKKSTF